MLVKACLNGGRPADSHPALPVSPDQLGAEARRAVEAGAGAVHVHPRREDGTESLEVADCAAAVLAIRREVPGVPVSLTTGEWIEPDLRRRLDLVGSWDPAPDFASANLSEEGAEEVVSVLLRRGIGVEAGLSSVGDAHRLVDSGLGDRCQRLLVEVEEEDPDEAVAAARAIDVVLGAAGLRAPRLHHGFGPATWAVIAAALERGRDVRVGLEDTLTLPDGRVAAGNAELVTEVVRLAGILRPR